VGAVTDAITVRGLHKSYGRAVAVDGVDLDVRAGEVFALLGPNGAGKTTTVEILEGFRRRTSGDVRVLGTDPQQADAAWRARVGVVLQSTGEFDDLTAREVVHHFATYYPAAADPDEIIDRVGLAEKQHARTRTLSGGQKRRLDVALGIVGRPELLFLDEPTAGFDPEARREFHDLVGEIADDDTTILLTTHDLDEAEKLADRILILAGGTIIADGSADELSRRMSTQAEVRWTLGGQRYVHATEDATRFVRELFKQYDDAITDLEVRRASLEDTYMSMVRQFEAGWHEAAVREFEVVTR
jgi:ABC-2 type transport system ATP-binding protein